MRIPFPGQVGEERTRIRQGKLFVLLLLIGGFVALGCVATTDSQARTDFSSPDTEPTPTSTPVTSFDSIPDRAVPSERAPQPSRVIRVPDDYARIAYALAAAYPGDTVQVSPGTYYEANLVVRSSVTLAGSGWQNTIIDGRGANVVVYGDPGSTIRALTIRGSGSGGFDAGVWISNGTVTISDSRLVGNAAGVWAWCFEPATCNIRVILERNIIDQNTSNGVNSNEPAVFTLRNNTIVHNAGSGVILNNRASLAENNIIANNGSDGLANNAGATVRYNDVWGNQRDYKGGGPGQGDISGNPLFCGTSNGDYRLQAASPAIDTGTPSGADMGALPFVATGTPPSSVSLTQLSANSWQISWAATNAAGYYVYYGPCTRQTTTVAHVVGATIYRIANVAPEDLGYVAVSSHDSAMRESSVRLANGIRAPCPTAPRSLEVGAFPGGQIRLQWQDTSSNESGFYIERAAGILSSTTHANYTQIATVPAQATSYTDTPPTLGHTYWYRIRAYNANGVSPYSNESFNATFSWVPNDDERYLLVLINEARAAPGAFGYPGIAPVPPLAYNALLNYAAHAHSQAILNSGFQFGHCDTLGRCPTERAHAVGYDGGVAENLIQGMTGPEWVRSSHQAFMNSEGHRNNMLCPCFTEAGIGHTYDPAKGGSSFWKGQYTETFSGRPGGAIPNLPSGIVVPYTGEPGTQFTFIVNYYHASGRAPSQPFVYIDGVPHTMNLSTGSPANGTYRYTTTLPSGNHDYYFAFTFAGGAARLPERGNYTMGVEGQPHIYTYGVHLPSILSGIRQ